MAKFPNNNPFDNLKDSVKNGSINIDLDAIKQKAAQAGEIINEKAENVKDTAKGVKDDIHDKLTELDQMLSQAVTDYNDAYTLMSDKGFQLYVERCEAADTVAFVENLINSIANHPKAFDAAFEKINTQRKTFKDSCEFADQRLQAAREAAGGAAAGNAALAWLGGGALSAGGGGVAAGNALLALAGPIGWTIAGATLLTSIILFANKKMKLDKEKNEEIEAVKKNTLAVKKLDAEINDILNQMHQVREALNHDYTESLALYNGTYTDFTDEQKQMLGALVNNTKALSALFEKTVA